MPDQKYEGRILTIYFPTAQELKDIQAAALSARIPYAHYAREMIQKGMASNQAPDISSIRELQSSKEALSMARRSLKDSESARLKLETELFALRGSLFLPSSPEGRGSLSSELVDLLQDGHVWRSSEIMGAMGIDAKNIDALKVLAGQLHALQDLKMIEETAKGWKWIA